MKIAFISFDFGEYCIQHANGLLAHGDVMLLLPKDMFDSHSQRLDSAVDSRTFNKPRLRQPLRQLACIRWIFRQIRDFQPDVIHFQRGHLWFNLALPWLKRYPIVVTIHDPRHHAGDRGSQKTPQFIMDFGYRQANQVIVHGTQLKEVLIDKMGIAPAHIHVIPHIAIGERDIPSTESNENEILFFGRIWQYKGLDYLIRAQPLINQEIPKAKFLICGTGEDMNRYRDMMVDPGRFECHNRWISDEERTEFFQRATVVVLPYIEATQSGVVPIAYAHSKPVIATRTGGLPDVIADGQTGLLVEPKDEIGLAKAVIRLLKDKQLCNSMGAAGHQKLHNELSPEVVCKLTADVYQSAIDARNAKNHPAKTELSKSI